jgi:hypothetical protein
MTPSEIKVLVVDDEIGILKNTGNSSGLQDKGSH